MSAAAADLCRRLEWDSDFFGVAIGRVADGRLNAGSVPAILGWCAERRIDCLYALVDSADTAAVRAAEAHGFRLTDMRVTLDRTAGPVAEASGGALGDVAIRPARTDDIPHLRAIAGVSHRDTRFHHDGGFPPDKADELYRIWIEKSVRDPAQTVLVPECGGHAAGYVTCRPGPGEGEIGLFAVGGSARGRGVGGALLAAAVRRLNGAAAAISVVTQGRNVAAQRLYQRAGFRTRRVELWYHRWFGGRAP